MNEHLPFRNALYSINIVRIITPECLWNFTLIYNEYIKYYSTYDYCKHTHSKTGNATVQQQQQQYAENYWTITNVIIIITTIIIYIYSDAGDLQRRTTVTCIIFILLFIRQGSLIHWVYLVYPKDINKWTTLKWENGQKTILNKRDSVI